MNIIVTLPRSRKEVKEAAEKEAVRKKLKGFSWPIGRVPKELREGDRVYVVDNNVINYYHTCVGINSTRKTVRVTGDTSRSLTLRCPKRRLNKPIPMAGFRGFMYADF